MSATPHTHACQHCATPVDCLGELRPNHDGWPPVTCADYHLEGGVIAFLLCEACAIVDAQWRTDGD